MTVANISDWISSLDRPQGAFGGLPVCPYANRAIVTVVSCECFDDAARLACWLDLPKHGIAVLEIRDTKLGAIDELNATLDTRDLVALVSDSSDPIIIDGYRTTQTVGTLLIIQGKSELQSARKQLANTRYYDRWSRQCRRKIGLPCCTVPSHK